ncbi:MAG: MATE family efflux transporter [Ruminococcaceae bacterium]|nr:MATE family efflux transporter [Oscillospiraceae bacterium]
MKRTTDMTVGSPTKHLLIFALPLIVTNLGQQLYMIVDAAIVGRGVGVQALAAVGATDWIYWLILWTVTGMTQGVSTYVSRYFGDKNYGDMNKSIAMCTLLCGAVGGVLTVAGLMMAKPLLLLLNTPDDILNGATTYLFTMIAGTLVVAAYNMAASVLRALGDGKTPLIAMGIAALLNVGLDLLFVLVFHMGILGAALASVLSQLVSFVFCFIRIRKIDCVRLNKETWRVDWKMMRSLFAFGMPLALEFIVIALGGIILQSAINLQGSTFIAGYTATNKVYGLLESSAISLGVAASTFLAQNYGAGKYDRVKKGVWTSTVIVLLMSVVVSGVMYLARDPFMKLFMDEQETGGAEAHAIAVYYLTILCVCLSVLYLLHIFRNALQAIGISVWSMLSGVAEFAARVVMSKWVIDFMGSDALFVAEPVAWLAALIFVLIPYVYYHRKYLSRACQKSDLRTNTADEFV